MITVGMNYHVLEGKQYEFEAKFKAVLSALSAATGHDESHLFREVGNDLSYLIISQWTEEKAFQDFIHSQMFKDVTDWGEQQILSARPRHKIYRN